MRAHDGYTLEARATYILEGLGIPVASHRRPLATLSGGFKLRVLLAQVLLGGPDVLLLDEPTNHLDILSIRWLEKFLAGYQGCAVVISHDQRFLDNVASHVLDVDYGTVTLYPGNYSAFAVEKAATRARKQAEIEKAEAEIAHKRAFVERFRYKATKAAQAQSRLKQIEKIEVEELADTSRRSPRFLFTPERPSGRDVLTVEGVSKAYGPKQVLRDVALTVRRGEKLAVIGPNGLGKSTLLKILVDHLEADAGEVRWGHEARVGYFAQDHREILDDPEMTALDFLWAARPKETTAFVRGHLGRVLFSGEDVDKRVGMLSGGEAARLVFGRLMAEQPNVLVLDEPTNHLDLEAIQALVAALQAFEGTVVFVSHDRWFVSELGTRILEVTPEGPRDFPGTYAEYLARLRRRSPRRRGRGAAREEGAARRGHGRRRRGRLVGGEEEAPEPPEGAARAARQGARLHRGRGGPQGRHPRDRTRATASSRRRRRRRSTRSSPRRRRWGRRLTRSWRSGSRWRKRLRRWERADDERTVDGEGGGDRRDRGGRLHRRGGAAAGPAPAGGDRGACGRPGPAPPPAQEPQVVSAEDAAARGLEGQLAVTPFGAGEDGEKVLHDFFAAAQRRGAGYVSDVNLVFASAPEGPPTECKVAVHPVDAVVPVQVPAGMTQVPVTTPVTRTVTDQEYRCTLRAVPQTRTVTRQEQHCQLVAKPVVRMETIYSSQYDPFSKSMHTAPQTHSVTSSEMVNDCRMVPVTSTVTEVQNKQECAMVPVTHTVTRYEFHLQSSFVPARVEYLQKHRVEESAPVCYALGGAPARGNRVEGRVYLRR